MSLICSFDEAKNRSKFYRRKDRDIFVRMKIRKNNLNCTKKSEIIFITPENLEELLIVFAIYDTKFLKKFLQYFIMAEHMIIISQLNNQQKILKVNLNAQEKKKEVANDDNSKKKENNHTLTKVY